MPLTKRQLAARILTLPPEQQCAAVEAFAKLYRGGADEPRGTRSQAFRDPEARRKYVGDPWAYFRDILGVVLAPEQEEALALIQRSSRVLLPSANNVGKTFLLGGYGVYRMDAVAALEGDGVPEQGGRILLPGPDHRTIFATIYSEMLALAHRAETRGHLMPGRRSENSVLWRVGPKWEVEPFSPQALTNQEVRHSASGRHHRNQVALIEEGQGVDAPLWRGAEGMCSSEGNKIISSFNPTEPVGPAYERARTGAYDVFHLSAFRHPNVLERAAAIPAAVSVNTIDARVRTETRERGPYPKVQPEPDRHDFVYALPPEDAEERGPREDGHLGHPDGELRVYRPESTFIAQVLGQYPETSQVGLFDGASWAAAVERWRQEPDPDEPPDRVGLDVSRSGEDETIGAPAWGDTAEALLRAYLDAFDTGPDTLAGLLETGRARVGELEVIPKGDGVDVAQATVDRFGKVPMNVDDGGVGSSPLDHLRRVLGVEAEGVSFAATPPLPMRPGFVPYCENVRTWMYVTAAKVVRLGLADVPDDPLLRAELMAHWLENKTRTVDVIDGRGRTVKKRMPSVLLCDKEELKKKIGRSPDRADAFVLSLFDPLSGPTKPKKKVKLAWGGRRR